MKNTKTQNIFRRFAIIALILVTVLGSNVVLSKSTTVLKNTVSAQETKPDYTPLIEKVKKDGHVYVIAVLNMDYKPEGTLTKDQQAAQLTKIKTLQDSVLTTDSLSLEPTSKKVYKHFPLISTVVDMKGLTYLMESPNISFIQENTLNNLTLRRSIPLIGGNATGFIDSNKNTFTGRGQTVAVLDSGVDSTHPFLTGKVVSEACFSTISPLLFTSSVCPDGSGNQIGTGAGVPCNPKITGCYHGTHVAGIVAGRTTNMTGVAQESNIIAIQVGSRVSIGAFGGCDPDPVPCVRIYDGDYILGLDRVMDLRDNFNIASVNMSIGGGRYEDNCDDSHKAQKLAIDNLRSVGIATIISSGNLKTDEKFEMGISSPACISSAISVGATYLPWTDPTTIVTTPESVTGFSRSDTFLNLLAPGSGLVVGTNPAAFGILSSMPGGGYAYLEGTSMAAPHVAGAWAVMKQKYPNATVGQIYHALHKTGVQFFDAKSGVTTPRIQLDKALNEPLPCEFPFGNIGDMVVRTSCTFTGFPSWAPLFSLPYLEGNLYVQDGAVLTIAPNAYFKLDLKRFKVTVRKGSGIIIKKTGKLSR